MEEVSENNRVKCTKCNKIISLFESDYSPGHAIWKHIDRSAGHEIDASYPEVKNKKSFWSF